MSPLGMRLGLLPSLYPAGRHALKPFGLAQDHSRSRCDMDERHPTPFILYLIVEELLDLLPYVFASELFNE